VAGFFKKLLSKFTRDKIDWDDIEESLISGDLGIKMTMQIMDRLQGMGRKLAAEDVVTVTREEIQAILPKENFPLQPQVNGKPTVILVVGVNGTGKTTSTAKLASHLRDQGHSVLLAAADTFRAAAIEQLDVWSQRTGIPIVKGPYKSDPSSVCFEGHQKAIRDGIDFLICDTAGRLHTKHNLMEELKKIERTLSKNDPDAPHEKILVVDATTGSNALSQAREFNKSLALTGLIVTKLDGSGKGGVVVPIQQELGIPTRYIGTGETATDFKDFDAKDFVENIL
jgi:fused signal recognition particle receptor